MPDACSTHDSQEVLDKPTPIMVVGLSQYEARVVLAGLAGLAEDAKQNLEKSNATPATKELLEARARWVRQYKTAAAGFERIAVEFEEAFGFNPGQKGT